MKDKQLNCFLLCKTNANMKILLLGSGGREHALAWKISQSSQLETLYVAPGNAGTAEIAKNISLDVNDFESIGHFTIQNRIDLLVVGPELPLVNGIHDYFKSNPKLDHVTVIGPEKEAAQLEGSKDFAKEIMKSAKIPTSEYQTFTDINLACEYIKSKQLPIVIKADGLAAGKGVTVAETIEQANSAIHDALEGNVFGNAGSKVVIEDFLEGEEASILAMIDGENIVLLASSQDHKRIFEKDLGPNTGGMGAYSPASIVNKDVEKKVLDRVYKPLLEELKCRNISYKGILYAGLMIKDNDPYVVEFNCRFGDPETQAVLVRWSGDIIPSIIATINGTLSSDLINWHKQSSACVVMVSGGYPAEYKKGYEIQNIKQANDVLDTFVFQAGTKVDQNKIITDGGRVLGITSLGEDLEDALSKAYISVETISYENAFYRNDIGHHELRRKKNGI